MGSVENYYSDAAALEGPRESVDAEVVAQVSAADSVDSPSI